MGIKNLIKYHLTLTFFQNGLPLHGETTYECEEWERVQELWQGACNNDAVTQCWITLTRECRGIDGSGGVCSYESDSEIVLRYKK